MARAAGVSPSTASRVLNGGKPVSAELDERVRSAAAEVGYISHVAASVLRGRRGMLAILTDELGAESLAEVAIAAGRAATAAGLTTTVSSAGADPAHQLRALRVLRSMGPRSVLLTGEWISDPSIRPELERELDDYVRAEGGHVVVLGAAVLEHPTVGFDDDADAYAVATRLAAGGGSRALVLAGAPGNATFRARVDGIVRAFADAGVVDIRVVSCSDDAPAAERATIVELAAFAPEMIACVSDRLAAGAHAAVTGLGLGVGVDVTLTGMDDLPVAAELTPPLTTLAHPLARAGALVVELALEGAPRDFRASLAGVVVERGTTRATS